MNFVSHAQLLEDVRLWSPQLPDNLVAVAGVPRSGLLPALHLALHRNLHLVSLAELEAGHSPWQTPLRRGVPGKPSGRVLVLDDSLSAGGTLREVRERLRHRQDCLFGAVYHSGQNTGIADVVFREVSHPRCFEWNLFHCDQMAFSCLDMDGVLCEDWTGFEGDSGPDQERYLEHLTNAQPLHIPSYPVLAIVTSRLEKYRPQTLGWLRRHRIRFRELVMSPHPTASARRQASDYASRKASTYARLSQARLFVESDPGQAREIFQRTRRPVLCNTTMKFC